VYQCNRYASLCFGRCKQLRCDSVLAVALQRSANHSQLGGGPGSSPDPLRSRDRRQGFWGWDFALVTTDGDMLGPASSAGRTGRSAA
jgi:hypothetical protein